jgi:hypothetical protein
MYFVPNLDSEPIVYISLWARNLFCFRTSRAYFWLLKLGCFYTSVHRNGPGGYIQTDAFLIPEIIIGLENLRFLNATFWCVSVK